MLNKLRKEKKEKNALLISNGFCELAAKAPYAYQEKYLHFYYSSVRGSLSLVVYLFLLEKCKDITGTWVKTKFDVNLRNLAV